MLMSASTFLVSCKIDSEEKIKTGSFVVEEKVYSLDDIVIHNQKSDCWMVIDWKVYDVSEYVLSGKHPPVIEEWCGLDATKMFSDVKKHSGMEAQSLLGDFEIWVVK